MPGDMNVALSLAQQICWDEGYGYRLGGHAASYADGADCGGLVFHCLHHAGYNVADTSPGTINMGSILRGIGFTEIPYSSSYVPKHGDIVVMNTTGHGHTTFICENILAYTDPGADSANTAVIPLAKVEASWHRGHTAQGDSKKNGTGAYWEVWCHKYNNLYDPDTYSPSEVFIYRDPNFTPSDEEGGIFGAIVGGIIASLGLVIYRRRKRRN